MFKTKPPQFRPEFSDFTEISKSLVSSASNLISKVKEANLQGINDKIKTKIENCCLYPNILNKDQASFNIDSIKSIISSVETRTELINSMSYCIDTARKKVLHRRGGFGNGRESPHDWSYEDILKFYIDLIGQVSSVLQSSAMVLALKVYVKMAVGHAPSIETIACAAIWGAMIADLWCKGASDPDVSERNRMAALCIGLLAFVTQVLHKELPINNYIVTVTKAYSMAGEFVNKNPKLYKVLFPSKEINCSIFPSWHKNLEHHLDINDKMTMGMAFNIHYTFRIGDIIIVELRKLRLFDRDMIQRLLELLSPIPLESELQRLFSLYTGGVMYS